MKPPASTIAPERLEPAQPPEFTRRIDVRLAQMVGVALLLAIPLLALAELLGDGRAERNVRIAGVTLTVEFPESARYGNRTQLRVEVSAKGGEVGGRCQIQLPASYLERFGEIRVFPDGVVRTAAGYEFDLPVSPDGASAPVFIDLMPDKYGWARGSLRIVVNGDEAHLPLETFVFP